MLPFYDAVSRALGVPKVHRALLGFAGLDGTEDVLEVGSGTGNLASMALRRHPTINLVGVDPDPRAVARAARKVAGSVRFDLGYGQALPYPNDSFDLALSALMVHHLDPAARKLTYAETVRVLRPGGNLFLADIATDGARADDDATECARRPSKRSEDTGSTIREQLRDAGFENCTQLARQPTRFGRVEFYRASKA